MSEGTKRFRVSAIRATLMDARSDLEGILQGESRQRSGQELLKAYRDIEKAIGSCTNALACRFTDEVAK